MGKRKLRACAKCGGRHGPPTGKGCTRTSELFMEKTEVLPEAIDGALPPDENGGSVKAMSLSSKEQDEIVGELPSQKLPEESQRHWEFVQQSAASQPSKAKKLEDIYGPPRVQPTSSFEESMAERMDSMENLLGRVAGVQQAQLERLVHLANHPVDKKTDMSAKSAGGVKPAEETSRPTTGAPRSGSMEGATYASPFDLDFEDSADQEWKEYYGIEMWKKEIERRRRNPFDQKVYGKKGEAVEDVEQLMVIAFKTIIQLLDLGQDVRGVAKHGLFMAEKAAKQVYDPIAFTMYDECVRERAGRNGPSAFSTVEQEDVVRCFCHDNTKASRAKEGSIKKSSRQKSIKLCHRFDDTGCSSKSCMYTHRCSSCDESTHGKKDCQKRKDKK